MTAFKRAWDIVKSQIAGRSLSYYMALDKLGEVDRAMGWGTVPWHKALESDDEMMRYLEEQTQTDKYGPQYKAMMGAILHSYMNDYDKGAMMEDME
tara:strand:+ start:231 stop:518 length:288 start_codon:yes stop_codon:yes gene_type:complete